MSHKLPSQKFMIVMGALIAALGLAVMHSSEYRPIGMGLAGIMVILGIGGIVSAVSIKETTTKTASPPAQQASGDTDGILPSSARPTDSVAAEISASFAGLLGGLKAGEPVWPAFDRWLRDTLTHVLDARQVRGMHVDEKTRQLSPIHSGLDLAGCWKHPPPALVGHVLTTGRRYLRGDSQHGELIQSLADQWPAHESTSAKAPVWLVPIQHRSRVIGLLSVGHLGPHILPQPAVLEQVADILQICWSYAALANSLERAQSIDPGSGVLNRSDLTATAEAVLRESREEGEPVVMAVLALEGLRRMDDQGERTERDWLIRQIGHVIHQRLRSDDLVGRFNDDHFVVVLRRVDLSLARLIVGKILQAARNLTASRAGLEDSVHLRCSLSDEVGGGLDAGLNATFDLLQQARQMGLELATSHDTKPARVEVHA